MVHRKLHGQLGSAGGQGFRELSLPYHVRRKAAFIFYSREGNYWGSKTDPQRNH